MKANREYRAMELLSTEVPKKRIDTGYYVEGYAARYDPYVLYEDENGAVYEEFKRGCFEGTDMTDIILQYNHEGKVLARQRNKTLIVEVDDEGLHICADLSKTASSRSLYEDISAGLVDRMSWGFIPGDYYFDNSTRTIVHTHIKKIFDVSAVSIPANDNTNIHARAFVDGEIERMAQELRQAELAKKKLLLRLKLGGF